ncbi:MAG: tetratricopeptide repeat protein [Chlorobiaceae bacterium]|nr:tetratricopeptide repeat protein [Chlorobiaceae bacterium]NTV61231.1 tetratricopeptide repeat protein [Chlorobiaceae bacterium]
MKDPALQLQSALILHQQGKLLQAEALYKAVLRLQPANFDAIFLLATAAAQQKKYDEALILFERAHKLNSRHPETLNNRGNVLKELKRYEEALASYDLSLSVRPGNAETYTNRGVALQELKRYEEALASYDRAVLLNPRNAVIYNNKGVVLQNLKRYEEAFSSYNKAISLKVDYAEAYNNRGNALRELCRYDESLESYSKAFLYIRDYPEAYNNQGNTYLKMHRYEEANSSYEKAITLRYDYAEALNNSGNCLQELKRYVEAIKRYENVFAVKPDYEGIIGNLLIARMKICEWINIEASVKAILDDIEKFDKSVDPFCFLAFYDSITYQKKVAEINSKKVDPDTVLLPAIKKAKRQKKINIGYYSADFRNHPLSMLLAGMFESHDRERFEITAFAFGPDTNDEMRIRVSAAFDRFIDIRTMSDVEVAELSRKLGIDIAIDLGGYTRFCRTGIFALYTAPVQVSYMGYPGTMGARYIDYIIADPLLIPEESRYAYTEKVIYLPDTYMVNDRKREISGKVFSRKEFGLPETGFVFCCFNNNHKILPPVFDSWMRILKKVKGSILWLLEDNEYATVNLRKEAVKRGIDADRLVFAKRMKVDEHLARHRLADLFLDTLPYNAHTTACDALWAGLPVLTRTGESFASRVAASVLSAIRLPELITHSQEEYEALAVELALFPGTLTAIKEKLECNRLIAPLFDTERFTRHIEQAYTQIYERYHAGLTPDHIFVRTEG